MGMVARVPRLIQPTPARRLISMANSPSGDTSRMSASGKGYWRDSGLLGLGPEQLHGFAVPGRTVNNAAPVRAEACGTDRTFAIRDSMENVRSLCRTKENRRYRVTAIIPMAIARPRVARLPMLDRGTHRRQNGQSQLIAVHGRR